MKSKMVTIERVTIDLSIDDLLQRWEILKWEFGIEKLLVTEYIENQKKQSFVAQGLSMEIEGDFALCTDWEYKIFDLDSVLKIFLKNNLVSIKLIPIDSGYREELKFKNSQTVYIEKAC